MTQYDAIDHIWNISREIRGMERVLFGESKLADELEIIAVDLSKRFLQKTSASNPTQQAVESVDTKLYGDTVNHAE